jgi:uncharacterized protein YkwD
MSGLRSMIRLTAVALSCAIVVIGVDAVPTPARAVTLCGLSLGLLGCSDNYKPSGQPSFYRSMATADAKVDAAAAASMISGYRRNNGLGVVSLDPLLMKAAEEQARAMASKNRFEHDAAGPFAQRIKRSGYDAKIAVENIGAGYHTLAEAFSGWRDSPPHRANMLRSGVTKMGIAAVYSAGTKYKVFWALILAAPDDRPDNAEKSSVSGKSALAKGARR